MPARDKYHNVVRNALIKDGWTITHDPLRLVWGKRDMYVDLGAKRLLGAVKGEQEIAVEIKSFLGAAEMSALEKAIGQFSLYRAVMEEVEPGRELYLAIPHKVVDSLFSDDLGKLVLRGNLVRLISFNPSEEVVVQWTN